MLDFIFQQIFRVVKKIIRESYFLFDFAYFFSRDKFFSKNIKPLKLRDQYLQETFETESIEISEDYIADILNHDFGFLGAKKTNLNYSPLEMVKIKEQLLKKISSYRFSNSKVMQSLIESDYKLIKWSQDFKSNFSWNSKKFSKYLNIDPGSGTDVKIPWELSRLQHIPNLALFHIATLNKEPTLFANKTNVLKEFKNQILDFILQNPVGFGINWYCAMDVSIRAFNLMLGYKILLSHKVRLEKDFEKVFIRTMCDHLEFIIRNIEYESQDRGNHYLANLIGLLSCIYCIDNHRLTKGIYSYCCQQLEKEMTHQFLPDGGNFEGSTYYHCESLEFIIFSALLIESMKKDFDNDLTENITFPSRLFKPKLVNFLDLRTQEHALSEGFYEQLVKSLDFLSILIKPNQSIPLIGDHDDGRLIKIFSKNSPDPVDSLPRDLLFFKERYLSKFRACSSSSYGEILDLFKPSMLMHLSYDAQVFNISSKELKSDLIINGITPKESLAMIRTVYNFEVNGMVSNYFPYFGLIIYKSALSFLAIRACTKSNLIYKRSHFHCDQLSMELFHNGEDIIKDPGSFCYNFNKEKRFIYRSANYHFSPFNDNDYPSFKRENIFEEITHPKININLVNSTSFSFSYNKNNSLHRLEGNFLEEGYLELIEYSANKTILDNSFKLMVAEKYGVESKIKTNF